MLTKSSFSLLVVFLAISMQISARDRNDAPWIEEVKNTPVSQIEAGLPQESVALWFADLVSPNETDYEVRECGEAPAVGTTLRHLLCVIAYTKPPHPGWLRRIQLRFVVATVASPKETNDRADVKPVTLEFLWATEGPSNPKSRRMVRFFSKLSDLEKLVRGSTTP
jgi:hypothetical protein